MGDYEIKDDDLVNISVREMTVQEKKLLMETGSENGCKSTTHIWRIEQDYPNQCQLFSNLKVVAIALGNDHVLLLTNDKKIYTQGLNTYGQLGIGDIEDHSERLCYLKSLEGLDVKSICCGANHNFVICKDGSVYAWGDSRKGQCGLGILGIINTPTKLRFSKSLNTGDSTLSDNIPKIRKVGCGELYTIMIDFQGCVWCCGSGEVVGHTSNNQECVANPIIVKKIQYKKAFNLASGENHCIIVTHDDFEESHFNLGGPNYRTVSVSNSYYSGSNHDLSTASKIPFLHSMFYSSKNDEDDHNLIRRSMRRSHSDPQVDVHSNRLRSTDPDSFVSELDLRVLSRHNTLKETNRNLALHGLPTFQENIIQQSENDHTLSSNVQESSSCFFSALDVNSSSATPIMNASTSSINSYISSEKSDDVASSTIFSGRKSLFEDDDKSFIKKGSIGLSQRSMTNIRSGIALFHLIDNEEDNVKGSTNTEVWSWGKNTYGQLGLGDLSNRCEPTLINKLKGKNIIQVTAGSDHSIALTAHGQVYSWGDNTYGQLTHSNTLIQLPKKVKALVGIHVWDIAAGRNFSLFMGDVSRSKTEVFYCGELDPLKMCRSISHPVIKVPTSSKKRNENWWRLSRRSKKIGKDASVDVHIRKFTHFENEELVRSVYANDFCFGCITEKMSSNSVVGTIYKFSRAERLFFQQLTIIQKAIIDPLISSESWGQITKLVGGEALLHIVDSFVDLLNATSTELSQLTEVIRWSLPTKELFSYLFSDSFRAVYDRYSICYSDALAVGLLHVCNKAASSIISKNKSIAKDLEKNLALSPASFENLLKAPLMRCHVFSDIAKQVASFFKTSSEYDHLQEVYLRWLSFSEKNTKRMISANVTRKYWDEFHKKLTEVLRDPKRRVLKSSKDDPLSLSRASRLSSHSYILCNDVFVHVQFNRSFQVFPLITLWADSVPDSNQVQNGIQITSPEESFVLSAGTPDGKISWLKDLNQAIASCLSACSSHSLDVDAVNSQSGLLTAAAAREATYVYVNHLKYKHAHYKGMWLKGYPHGRGKMSWEDGTYYEGEFIHGLFYGYGQMKWPQTALNLMEKMYEGEWFEGMMFGYGKMKYGQFEEYIGHFRDGLRHGHGMLKTLVPKNTLETVYIGDWVNDVKQGYGVLDYVIRGEKYMGMWVNDQRQGYGVVVTVDGVYYEGKFVQNKLVGRGILLSEDETCYEGEFTADMLLNGKGVLTLPNGDFIDGTFFGNWGESIKVNGTFSKFSNPLKPSGIDAGRTNLLESTSFAIDANMKWSSLFQECFSAFGCHDGNKDVDPESAWRCADNAVQKNLGSSIDIRLQVFPHDVFQLKKKNYKDYMKIATNLKELQDFLSKIFDTPGHPLNLLVDGLVDVYRATYVGVGAHRRLLPHAVAEAKSYVSRVFNVLRVLFPDLHDEEFVLLSNDSADGVLETAINSVSLLHPLLLPRLYPPLFTLYALQTEKSDALYTEKLYYLNKRGDIALLSFLGLNRSFWLMSEKYLSGNKSSQSIENERPYVSAIEMLERISTTYSPMGKIEIIRRTFGKIHEAINEHYKGQKKPVLSMDDLFPLFQYIVIRTRVPHLGSEIKFIEDLVDQATLVGEAGHMITTLSACYFQIQQERDRD
ncbi:alsin isoform X2 [Hydra vulgaris]|uniref:Alsin isoform X2 n=1 Tax=Hydra vulgaris TaxID=6087 RepID=A0ABM4C0T7_HYDVU